MAEELNLPSPQLLGLFNRIIRKSIQYFNEIAEKHVESTMLVKESINEGVKLDPLGGQGLQEELESAAKVWTSCNLIINNSLIPIYVTYMKITSYVVGIED